VCYKCLIKLFIQTFFSRLKPIDKHNFAFDVFQERQSEEELNKNGKYTEGFENWVTHGQLLYV